MNAFHACVDFLRQWPMTEQLGRVLLHSLWQDAALAAICTIVLYRMRGASAGARYLAACASMGLMLLLPIVTVIAIGETDRVPSASTAADGVSLPHIPAVQPAPQTHFDLAPTRSSAIATNESVACWNWAVAAWIGGIAVLSLRHLVGWTWLHRLIARADSSPDTLSARLLELQRQAGMSTPIRLRVVARNYVPATMGWLRPLILVPMSALTDLPPQHLEALLLHELAHIRRHDYLANLLQTAVETLLFYHPAVWWISGVIRQERENCCDDFAASHCGSRLIYARALTAMEELRSVPTHLVMAARGGKLLARIQRIVGAPANRSDYRTPGAAIAFAVATVLILWIGTARLTAQDQTPRASGSALATLPATNAATPATSGILPEDLRPTTADYRLCPGDMLHITLRDLTGPGKESMLTRRITESGLISLPYMGPIRAAGYTEIELEKAIQNKSRELNLIANLPVTVECSDPRGKSFAILGQVARPNNLALLDPRLRVLDAIALAGGAEGSLKSVLIIRQTPGNPSGRKIQIPGAQLLAGDASVNVFVVPGDTIIVSAAGASPAAPAQKIVHLMVDENSVELEGKAVTWDELAASLEKLPDHPGTVLEIAAKSDALSVGRFFQAEGRASELVRKYGFKYLSITGVHSAAAPAPAENPKAH